MTSSPGFYASAGEREAAGHCCSCLHSCSFWVLQSGGPSSFRSLPPTVLPGQPVSPPFRASRSRTVTHCTTGLGCSLPQVLSEVIPTEARSWTPAGDSYHLPAEMRVCLSRKLGTPNPWLGEGLEKNFMFGSFGIRSSSEIKAGLRREEKFKTRTRGSPYNKLCCLSVPSLRCKLPLAASASGCGYSLRKRPKSIWVVEYDVKGYRYCSA